MKPTTIVLLTCIILAPALILQAANSQDEHDALSFQQSAQIMAELNNTSPIARITHLDGLTVCQTNDGTVVVPIQWTMWCGPRWPSVSSRR
jgi:hypothetical protein